MPLVKVFAKVIQTPAKYLIPIIIAISIFGVYAVQAQIFDLVLRSSAALPASCWPAMTFARAAGARTRAGSHDREQYAPGADHIQRRLYDLPAEADVAGIPHHRLALDYRSDSTQTKRQGSYRERRRLTHHTNIDKPRRQS